MNKAELPRATHQGKLHIANLELPCFVLEDGRRVISQRSLQLGIGMSSGGGKRGERKIAQFLDKLGEKGVNTQEMTARVLTPLAFKATNGAETFGYEAAALADLCELILDARDKFELSEPQKRIATFCEIIMRALAKVGIIALVDEATGFQEVRDRLALQKILEKYLLDEYASWAKRFPNEFYQEMFRLKGWQWNGMSVKRPSVVGHYTNDIVYKRLAPEVLNEIKKKNAKLEEEKGFKVHQHRWLTLDTGVHALDRHIYALIALMKGSRSYEDFHRRVVQAFPAYGEVPDLFVDEDAK